MATSYVFTPMDEDLIYETFIERLALFAKKSPDRETFVFYSSNGTRTAVTNKELYQQATFFAKGLIKLGIKPGDKVGVGLPNILECVICHFGVIMAGGVVLGLTFARKDGEDVKHSLEKAGNCTTIIFDSGEDDRKMKIVQEHIVSHTDASGKILQNSAIKSLAYAVHCGKDINGKFPCNVDRVIQLGKDYDVELPILNSDDPCIIFQTSGTTGNFKLVPKTHFEVINMINYLNNKWNIVEEDTLFHPGPFTWIGGYISHYIVVGCKWVTVESMLALGTMDKIINVFLDIIDKNKCNKAVLIAPILYAVLESGRELSGLFPLDTIFIGGYPLQHSIAKIVGPLTRKFIYIYAGTEFGSISCNVVTDPQDFDDYDCGRPTRGNEVKIVGSNGQTLLRNEMGTIHIRSRAGNRFESYLNDPEKTKDIQVGAGWLNTNDIGYINNRGHIISMGRNTDLITVGGAKISPFMIEALLVKHPEISSVSVVAIPDDKTFQQMCACIIRKIGSCVSWDNIEGFLREQIIANPGTLEVSRYVPAYHIFMESFPVTPSGKVIKYELTKKVKLDLFNCSE